MRHRCGILKTDKIKLVAVQRHAARFVFGDCRQTSSPTEMLDRLQLPPLEQRRQTMRAIMIYKLKHKTIVLPTAPFIPTGLNTRGHNHRFRLPYSRIDDHKASFYTAAIKLWNSLPDRLIGAPSIEAFRHDM